MASGAENNPIIYIARDIERALGREPVGNYFIITNTTSYALEVQKRYPDNIWLFSKPELLDTYELLMLPEVQETIAKYQARLLVFKNTSHIQKLCAEKGWNLLNPSAELSEKIENKITQVAWLGELASFLPQHSVTTAGNLVWEKKPFIIQWAHSHTGEGTLLISSEAELETLKKSFPHREVRATEFIKGPMFTVNSVITESVILLGNISYQITGILPFTDNPFSTIGNDWSVPHTILSDQHIKDIENIAQKVGQKMQKDGWRGLFGIDVIYDEERDQIHLIEINPRQPASTTFESEIQATLRMQGVPGVSLFEAHIYALTGIPVAVSLIPINDGAQILQRVTKASLLRNEKNIEEAYDTNSLISAGYKVISYKNTKPNADLLRIQSAQGIMETHTKLNKRGKQILEALA